jgi:2'-5' RNA ligase
MRLFVAVWPPADVVAALAGLDRPERRGVRWTTPGQWHVTLRFLGSMGDPEEGKRALDRVAPVAGPAEPVAVAGPTVVRLGPSILCIPVAGLENLAAAVVAATAGLGEPPPERPFRGHITLARAQRGIDVRALAGQSFSAEWPVGEVTLVSSETRPSGARYRVVAGYPVA